MNTVALKPQWVTHNHIELDKGLGIEKTLEQHLCRRLCYLRKSQEIASCLYVLTTHNSQVNLKLVRATIFE